MKQTIIQAINRNVPNQWLITEQFSIIDLLIDFDTISKNGRNIYEWNQINQTRLEIDFDWTYSNELGSSTFRRFGISNTINIQYSEILSNVNERGLQKLFFTELMDVRFGRSTFNYFQSFHSYFALLTNMMNHVFHKVHHNRV